ncbi:MAG: GNAT family N-acetyltransferase [Ilumatobacteraceae bacterium]
MGHRVRSAAITDADELGAAHVAAWEAAYRGGLMPDDYLDGMSVEDRAQMWREGLASPPLPRAARLVAEVDGDDGTGRVVGFVMAGPEASDPDTDVGEVYAINVHPEHWGGGIGADLLSAGAAHLAEAGFDHAILWVHPDNERTCRFYRAQGWSDTGIRRREHVLGVEVPEARYRRPLP